ncbi:hypothetical protein [Streptomyces bottropensis]|uniref:hypothetical protein n=1 Tax=Streptomyces bottropensis TaxID=42235 RepID=UPI00369730E0
MAELPEPLLAYFAQREAQRAEAVDAFLSGLTEYERGLFHDAAVMGYVRGSMHPRNEEIPLNKAIVADVVNACFAHSDLYPTVNADFEERRIDVEYFVQCQQPDGSWMQCTSASPDEDYYLRQRDLRRESMPEFVFRLAQRTTRVIVRAEPTEVPQ